MKNQLLFLGLFLLFSSIAIKTNGQIMGDSTQLWRIETEDGNNYVGTIKTQDAEKIYLHTRSLGEITIWKVNVVSMEPVSPDRLKNGEFWQSNVHYSRYFWGPNGYGLEAGKGYYQNTWVLLNQVSVGITDNLSIGLGTIPLFLFGADFFPVWLTPKVSFPVQKDKWNMGAGALLMTVAGEETDWFGILYGVSTWGDRDKNFTLGLGYGFAGDDWAQAPTVTLSGMIRTGKRGYVITENYLLDIGDEVGVVFSAGGRRTGKITLDYGGIIPIFSEAGLVVIPWLGITVPFGKGKFNEE